MIQSFPHFGCKIIMMNITWDSWSGMWIGLCLQGVISVVPAYEQRAFYSESFQLFRNSDRDLSQASHSGCFRIWTGIFLRQVTPSVSGYEQRSSYSKSSQLFRPMKRNRHKLSHSSCSGIWTHIFLKQVTPLFPEYWKQSSKIKQ